MVVTSPPTSNEREAETNVSPYDLVFRPDERPLPCECEEQDHYRDPKQTGTYFFTHVFTRLHMDPL